MASTAAASGGGTDGGLPLAGGTRIPRVGLGTWQARGASVYDAVRAALDIGYRHVDTATMYRNEEQVGRALRDSGVPREQLFVTTKLPPQAADDADGTLAASLRALGLDHVDLWLVHWPPRGGAAPATWERFVRARESGRARAVGVSNYSVAQVDQLTRATGATPEVNQVPYSPWQHEPALLAAHRERGVLVEGYSPLNGSRLADAGVRAVAAAHGRTPAQVVLRWHLEHDVAVIPKSVRPERIRENLDVLDWSLTAEEVARLDALG